MKLAMVLALGMPLAQLGQLDAPPTKQRQYIVYVTDQQVVPAGKRAILELHFKVEDGFHVNSHKPNSDLQIPTVVDLGPSGGVKLETPEYPAGKTFTFSFDPSEKLDVYTDDFVVKVPVVATSGSHELKGALKYQACDHAACYPPKTLPLDVLFTAK